MIIFQYGLVYSEVSTVRWWYEAIKNGSFEKCVIKIINSHMNNAPLIVDKMPDWLHSGNEVIQNEINQRKKELKKLCPNFESGRRTGIHATTNA